MRLMPKGAEVRALEGRTKFALPESLGTTNRFGFFHRGFFTRGGDKVVFGCGQTQSLDLKARVFDFDISY